MKERDQRRADRMARGHERATAARQPTRRQLEAGAHLLDCDRQHEPWPAGRCNLNMRPKPEDQ